jgi:hypothetical protein
MVKVGIAYGSGCSALKSDVELHGIAPVKRRLNADMASRASPSEREK